MFFGPRQFSGFPVPFPGLPHFSGLNGAPQRALPWSGNARASQHGLLPRALVRLSSSLPLLFAHADGSVVPGCHLATEPAQEKLPRTHTGPTPRSRRAARLAGGSLGCSSRSSESPEEPPAGDGSPGRHGENRAAAAAGGGWGGRWAADAAATGQRPPPPLSISALLG
jgi:hypothetical protein